MARVRVIIQCRLNSSRLPGKALLPIAGMETVVLCALRANNTGLDTCVAISDQASDEPLMQLLVKQNINFCRGPLNDVLKRFTISVADLSDNDIVVRLTADNLFPDGGFIEELICRLVDCDLQFLGTLSPLDGLPYGMSAEAFRIGALRKADEKATSIHDREHVTPWIKNNYGQYIFTPAKRPRNLPHLRCTMDRFEDYILIQQLFRGVNDPVKISWFDLCERLSSLPNVPEFRVPYKIINNQINSCLTLGTAQMGINYGAANQTGMPSLEEVTSILDTAVKHGITSFDTARAYGESESRLGQYLGQYKDSINIITKLSPLRELSEDMTISSINSAVDASIFQSCRELRLHNLPVVLLHNPEHLHIYDGLVWKRLESLRNEGIIDKLGVSIYNPQQLEYALKNFMIDHVQLPFNLLDWRWRKAGVNQILNKYPHIVVHARSIYLQGILLAESDKWPKFAQKDAMYWTSLLQRICDDLERDSIQDLCIAYILGQSWIHSAVIGVETLIQLKENLELFMSVPLSEEECNYVERKLQGANERLLNPSLW